MRLIENLFVSGSVTNPETVIYRLRRDMPVRRLVCIVYFTDRNRLELLSSKELFHARNRTRPAEIVGIAMGRRDALSLLQYMAEEALADGRNAADPLDWIR